MKNKLKSWCALAALFLLNPHQLMPTAHAQGTAFAYEGRLFDGANPASGSYDIAFTGYGAATGGSAGGSVTNLAVSVTNGLFLTTLDYGSIPNGAPIWLELAVRTNGTTHFTTLAPRQQILPVPYAMFANTASNLVGTVSAAGLDGTYSHVLALTNTANNFAGDGAALANVNAAAVNGLTATNFWQTGGNGGTVAGQNFLGTTDNQPLELRASNLRVMRLEPGGVSQYLATNYYYNLNGAPNVIGGSPGNYVLPGTVGVVIGGGGATNYTGYSFSNSVAGASDFSTIGGGVGNTILNYDLYGTIGGGDFNVIQDSAFESTIAGGGDNQIGEGLYDATIGGGFENWIQTNASGSTIAGGYANVIQTNAQFSTIGGGDGNQIQTLAGNSFIGGGVFNMANSANSTIGGGQSLTIGTNAAFSFMGGGRQNAVADNSLGAVLSGGEFNTLTDAADSVVAGGVNNHVTGAQWSAIGGGNYENIYSDNSFIGAGQSLTIGGNSKFSVVSGGFDNIVDANSSGSVLAGGENNVITNATGSIIAGGTQNTIINAPDAIISGGIGNSIGDIAANGGVSTDSLIAGGSANYMFHSHYSSIGGGGANILTNGYYSVLGGGSQNSINGGAGGDVVAGGSANFINLAGGSVIGGGNLNTVGDGYHNSGYGTIPGGYFNYALGGQNFAAGTYAQATNKGAFVWSDALAYGNDKFASQADNEFAVRARGGVRLVTGGAGLTVDGVTIVGPGSGTVPSDHSVTLAKLSAGTPVAGDVLALAGDGSSLTWVNPTTFGGTSGWGLTGNSGTSPVNNFLGTTDNQPLEVRVNNLRALRIEPGGISASAASAGWLSPNGAPNMIGGSPVNVVVPGVVGAVIGGGGTTSYFGSAYINSVAADFGAISGGYGNQIQTNAYAATIGGGIYNQIQTNSYLATIGGGYSNVIQTFSSYAVIGGGFQNLVQSNAYNSTIGGGGNNLILTNAYSATIAGGYMNQIQNGAFQAVIGGGLNNQVQTNANFGTIGGGANNQILWFSSGAAIAGGSQNQIQTNAFYATIGGGYENQIQNNAFDSVICGGRENTNSGAFSTIMGGFRNVAGLQSFAAGNRAKAVNSGAFVWADATDADFSSTANNQFAVRANGGVTFTSGNGGGNQAVSWTPGSASWSFSSDRNLKDRFATVDQQSVLDKIAQLPIVEWSYKGYDQRHIGPMAQDFHKLFPLNENDKALQDADLHGVALAAIQGLNQKVEEKESRIEAQAAQLQQQAEQIAALQQSLAQLQKAVQTIVDRH